MDASATAGRVVHHHAPAPTRSAAATAAVAMWPPTARVTRLHLGTGRPSGSSPAGTSVQVPALPATAHDLQVPVQAVMQQTPWAQMPELQSSSIAHVPPSGRLPQLPALQVFGAVQSPSTEQVIMHFSSVPHI